MIRDQDRLAALQVTGLLDSEPEESFDRLARLAAQFTKAPVALVSFLDEDREFFKSRVGLTEPWASRRQVPISHSFCQYAVNRGEAFVVEDARGHPLVGDNPAIADMGIVAYAGIPLITRAGHALGCFCAIETRPRTWSNEEIQVLEDLALSVMTEIELRNDIHDRLTAEAALKESEARFRNIVESASDIIFGTDAYGFFTYVNPVAAKIMGYPSSELIGMHFTGLVREDARAATDAFYRRQFRDRVEHTYFEFPAVNAEGRDVWVGQSVRLVLENDWIVGSQAVARDITERREIDRLKDEFVSVVSHELRTPLTSLRGSLGLLASGRLKEEQAKRMVDVAILNTDRLIRLIGDFLDLERMKSGRVELHMREVDLMGVVDNAIGSVAAEAERLHVTIERDVAAGRITVDADRIIQVLVNLISNAIKFSEAGATVRVTAKRIGFTLIVIVEDSGRGIPAESLETIFEPFHQVDASDSRDKGGVGLGLPISKSIVEQHGGTITIESELGRGSTVTVTIPA